MFHLYGLIVGIAIVVGWSLAEQLDPKVGKVAPWVMLGGLIGARLWHVGDYWSYYSENLIKIAAVGEGGLSIWGGILGGGIGLAIARARHASPLQETMNTLVAMVTALPLAQAIGRIANGVNGEFTNLVWGVPWWGMEAILDLILFGLIWIIPKKWRVGGYLLGYGAIRLVLQPYRR